MLVQEDSRVTRWYSHIEVAYWLSITFWQLALTNLLTISHEKLSACLEQAESFRGRRKKCPT